ncbi:unnamed protein product [Paramecium octaurelia]|uniref:Uncharacterized protein n=1 Tax=Paramecium octaurelia TaxID=43137 RepID=A0A8S1T702_PAROT|nr:unnamed protein product [Paramecium octaurelia]
MKYSKRKRWNGLLSCLPRPHFISRQHIFSYSQIAHQIFSKNKKVKNRSTRFIKWTPNEYHMRNMELLIPLITLNIKKYDKCVNMYKSLKTPFQNRETFAMLSKVPSNYSNIRIFIKNAMDSYQENQLFQSTQKKNMSSKNDIIESITFSPPFLKFFVVFFY